ncbi:MAG: ferrous iron transporter B, partial [Rhodothermales bacterium]
AFTGSAVRGLLPGGLLEDLLVEGVVTGVGNVLVFLPQILLLFFFLGLMEDTGYMARTAFIMDRLMRRLGLSGGSVVPLLSGYACAIPAIMAARTLDSERDRLITIMVVPLMSCSARLPVYTLFIAAFIPAGSLFGIIGFQGLTMLSLYLLGTLMAFFAAWVLKTFVFKSESSMFVMELPPYRAPQLKQVLRRMLDRSKMFVLRAGKIIFGMSVLLWFLASFPRVDAQGSDATSTHLMEETDQEGRQIRESFIGRFGRTLEPVMQPLGFDWKITAGIISALAAREVIVSTMATIYSVGGSDDESSPLLRDALKADRYPDGTRVYTPLVAVSLMVFFVFALQCMSTLAIARRETNSWLWPAVMWGYMFALAYVSSFVVYQGGLLLGLA